MYSERRLQRWFSPTWRGVLALSAVVALSSGCLPEWTARPTGAPRVAAVGDSILRQLEFYGPTHPNSERALTRSIQDDGWRASVRGENGWTIARIRALAADAAHREADGVIIVGGVNDVAWIRQQPDPRLARDVVARQLRGTLDDVAGATCVVWPTIAFGPNYYFGGTRGDWLSVNRINTVLRRQALRRTNLVVPEWGEMFDSHPRFSSADGLHLSRAGEAALQGVLLRAMSGCMQAASPPPSDPTTSAPSTTASPTATPTTATAATAAPATTVPPTTIPPPTSASPSTTTSP